MLNIIDIKVVKVYIARVLQTLWRYLILSSGRLVNHYSLICPLKEYHPIWISLSSYPLISLVTVYDLVLQIGKTFALFSRNNFRYKLWLMLFICGTFRNIDSKQVSYRKSYWTIAFSCKFMLPYYMLIVWC